MQDGEVLTAESTFTIDPTGKMDKNGLLSRNIFNDDFIILSNILHNINRNRLFKFHSRNLGQRPKIQ